MTSIPAPALNRTSPASTVKVSAPDFNRDTAYVNGHRRNAGFIAPRLGEKIQTNAQKRQDARFVAKLFKR